MASDESFSGDADVAALRIPPHSVAAEQSVLGALLIDNGAWDRIAEQLTERDFFRKEHRIIFAAINRLAAQDDPFDVVTLHGHLADMALAERVGGLSYLDGLTQDTPSAANIGAYARIVRNHAICRQLIEVASQIADDAFHPAGRSTEVLLDGAESLVFGIAEQGVRGQNQFQPVKGLLAKAVDRIEALYGQGSAITGLPTGFDDFDQLTSGLQPGDLVVVAGRPSMGKTTFAMNIAENAAIRGDSAVGVFSMEMPGDSLAMRMMSSLGRVSQQRVRTGQLEDEDWPRITSAVQMLSQASLFIDDTPSLSPAELRARARRLKREHGLSLIVIDYLQLMQISGSVENRATEIAEISRGLKSLAKELSVPVIALSQLNRSLEQRQDKRPVMSDLRESGAIEQDADLIAFIYRDEVYNPDSPDKGKAEIIVGKQRNGPIGVVPLTFLGKYTRFENFVSDTYSYEGGLGDGGV